MTPIRLRAFYSCKGIGPAFSLVRDSPFVLPDSGFLRNRVRERERNREKDKRTKVRVKKAAASTSLLRSPAFSSAAQLANWKRRGRFFPTGGHVGAGRETRSDLFSLLYHAESKVERESGRVGGKNPAGGTVRARSGPDLRQKPIRSWLSHTMNKATCHSETRLLHAYRPLFICLQP